MSQRFLLRPRFLIPAVVIILAGVVIGVYLLRQPPSSLPARGSPLYVKYVEAFQVGVAALDLGSPDEKADATKPDDTAVFNLAYSKLTEAIETIPEEPAGWANRGLWYLRRNRLEEAAKDLQHADQLAPDNPEIQKLLGLLARQRGKFKDVAIH